MANVIDFELLEKLEKKVGKEEAKKIAQTIELIYNELDKKSESLANQKKLELKDELAKEFATKADLVLVKTELEAEIENELDKKSESLANQKKLELKDELAKEFATKADLVLVKTELEAEIEEKVLKLDRKFTVSFLILAFLIIFISKDAFDLIIKLLPFAK